MTKYQIVQQEKIILRKLAYVEANSRAEALAIVRNDPTYDFAIEGEPIDGFACTYKIVKEIKQEEDDKELARMKKEQAEDYTPLELESYR